MHKNAQKISQNWIFCEITQNIQEIQGIFRPITELTTIKMGMSRGADISILTGKVGMKHH